MGSGGRSFTLLNKNVGHLFSLPLSTNVGTKTLLQEFKRSLILGDTQQFHDTLLVRCETSDFSDNLANELVVFRCSL